MPLRKQQEAGQLVYNRINRREAAVLEKAGVRIAKAEYDFDQDGGAVGDVDLGIKLPENAIVKDVILDVETAATSGGLADYQLKVGSVDVLPADLDFDDATDGIDAIGLVDVSTLVAKKFPLGGELKLEIVTAALTAGKMKILVEYIVSE